MVSSYIPAITTLLEPKRIVSSHVDCNILSIIQSNTPYQSPLPYASEELVKIAKRASDAEVTSLSFEGDEATVDKVLSVLPKYSVVHFACHGSQDLKDPLNSFDVIAGALRSDLPLLVNLTRGSQFQCQVTYACA